MAPIRNSRRRNPSIRALEASAASNVAQEEDDKTKTGGGRASRSSKATPATAASSSSSTIKTTTKTTKGKSRAATSTTTKSSTTKGKAKAPAGKASRSRATPAAAKSSKAPTKKGSRSSTRGKSTVATVDTEVENKSEQAEDEDGDEVMEDADAPSGGEEEDDEQQDLTLYCICLGFDTGEQPMIQCEHCENWFHFNCVGLTDKDEAKIEAYCCDICEGMGLGYKTRYVDGTKANRPASSEGDDDDDSGSDARMTSEDEDDEEEENEATGSDRDEDEYGGSGDDDRANGRRRKRARVGGRSTAKKRSRKSNASANAAIDDADDEYVGDEGLVDRPRRRPAGQDKSGRRRTGPEANTKNDHAGSPPTGNTAPVVVSSTPASDKTRVHVVGQLTTIFQSIFAASEEDAQSISLRARAAGFAESIEAELFDGFAEVDAKGVRGPRQKYAAKFRSLHYNLKTNAAFRSRISGSELSPTQIVAMSQEDLMTPELRAMADSVRAASLKHSVKEVLAAPRVKMTHKGEEEIDTFATGALAEDESRKERERQTVDQRERSASIVAHGSPAQSPAVGYAQFSPEPARHGSPTTYFEGSPPVSGVEHSPRVQSPGEDRDDLNRSPSVTSLPDLERRTSTGPGQRRTSLRAVSAGDLGLDDDDDDTGLATGSPRASVDREVDAEEENDMKPPPLPPTPRHRASFDMASVWGQVQPSASEEKEAEAGDEAEAAEPDATSEVPRTTKDNDDFEAAFLRGDDTAPVSASTAAPAAEKAKESDEPPVKSLAELDTVWTGDLIVPDEGGFPATAVQIGGRFFGPSPQIWNQLLPRTLAMDGRIPTDAATKYLVECSFAASRELVVVGVLPDLSGPSPTAPHKPPAESCLAKHAHILDFYVKRSRIGVIQPPEKLKRIVKDIYIVPLRKTDPLPEYIELLDEHGVPETGQRDSDLLLCVLVVQKNSLPSLPPPPIPEAVVEPPPPSVVVVEPSSPLSVQAPPPSSSMAQTSRPSSDSASIIPNIDPSALQSLLANPALLQSLSVAASASSYSPARPAASPFPQSGMGSATPPQVASERKPSGGYVHPSRLGLVPDAAHLAGGPSPPGPISAPPSRGYEVSMGQWGPGTNAPPQTGGGGRSRWDQRPADVGGNNDGFAGRGRGGFSSVSPPRGGGRGGFDGGHRGARGRGGHHDSFQPRGGGQGWGSRGGPRGRGGF